MPFIKKPTNLSLTNRLLRFTIILSMGHPYADAPVGTRICGKEVGTDASALCHPRGTLILQAVGAYCARLCGLTGRVFRVYTAFPHRLPGRRWYFYTHFSVRTERRYQL